MTREKGEFSLRDIKRTKVLKIFLPNGSQVNFDSFKILVHLATLEEAAL